MGVFSCNLGSTCTESLWNSNPEDLFIHSSLFQCQSPALVSKEGTAYPETIVGLEEEPSDPGTTADPVLELLPGIMPDLAGPSFSSCSLR